jgi:hypothetical protein
MRNLLCICFYFSHHAVVAKQDEQYARRINSVLLKTGAAGEEAWSLYEQGKLVASVQRCHEEMLLHPGDPSLHEAVALISAEVSLNENQEQSRRRNSLVRKRKGKADSKQSCSVARSSLKRLVVYTAIFTDNPLTLRDLLRPVALPHFDPSEVDFVCFTNSYRIVPFHWQVTHVPLMADLGGRLTARYYKIMGHKLLPNYEYTLWMVSVS